MTSRRDFLLSTFISAGLLGQELPKCAADIITDLHPRPETDHIKLTRTATAAEIGGGIGFDRYKLDATTIGAGNPDIYITSSIKKEKRPLILYVSAGCGSVFTNRDGNIMQAGSSLHDFLREFAGDRARVMVVDKPGVDFCVNWSPEMGTSRLHLEFLKHDDLNEWSELLRLAIAGAGNLDFIDKRKTLLVGHSDSATVVAHMAARMPELSHVAPLAPVGLSLFWDFLYKAGETDNGAESARNSILEAAYAMRQEPDRIDKFWAGWTWKHWMSGYLHQTTLDSLSRTNAHIYTAHGTADDSNSIEGFDFMCAMLKPLKKKLTVERIENADHSFLLPNEPHSADGLARVFRKIIDWFFETT